MDDGDSDDETDDSDLDEPGWRITHEMMDCVDLSDWMRSELGDGVTDGQSDGATERIRAERISDGGTERRSDSNKTTISRLLNC